MKKNKKRSDCPLSYALDVFGDKWSLLIIRDLLFRKKFSFNEFKTSEEKIATNILADRLSLMEEECIIFKETSSKNKSKYVYQLTAKGLELAAVLISMMEWGVKHSTDAPPTPKKIINLFKENPEQLINEYQKNLMAAQ